MLTPLHLLAQEGFTILATAGCYCRAERDQHVVLLRWDGETWLVL